MTKNKYRIKTHKEYKSVKDGIKLTQEHKRHFFKMISNLKDDLKNSSQTNIKNIIEKDIKFYTSCLETKRTFLVNAHNLIKQYELNN